MYIAHYMVNGSLVRHGIHDIYDATYNSSTLEWRMMRNGLYILRKALTHRFECTLNAEVSSTWFPLIVPHKDIHYLTRPSHNMGSTPTNSPSFIARVGSSSRKQPGAIISHNLR
jgi:hypothetical protein